MFPFTLAISVDWLGTELLLTDCPKVAQQQHMTAHHVTTRSFYEKLPKSILIDYAAYQ
ncbi:hypothetical protein IF2G_07959 [Cordyceps javanica]|nr:hypothetical protein IF2G_07959 [Cordyceps javanica]